MSLLEEAWEQREQVVFTRLFGDIGDNVYPLTFEIFKNQFDREEIDPRWLHYGVFKSPPNPERNTWLYVSSGMSNPWDEEEKEEYSGLGTEFILETQNDESWAIPLVQSLVAYNILISVGMFGEIDLLDYGARIPQQIKPNISHIILGLPINHPETIELISGNVDLLQLVGITQEEFQFAKNNSSLELCKKLIEEGVYPITNQTRESIKNV